MGFLDERYLLETEAAVELYDAVRDLPIVDPHSHVDVRAVVENEPWDNVWQVEGATDHYVWQLMRDRGVPEAKITGDAEDREKWTAFASIVPELAGDPTYEWLHLDLRRRFGIDERVGPDTADEIWERTARALDRPEFRPQAVLEDMGVEVICSSDDPTDSLSAHERAGDAVDGVDVRPTWRPDRALKIGREGWSSFVADLEAATGTDADDLSGFLAALARTHEYFAEHGCVACDVGLDTRPASRPVGEARAAAVYRRRRRGQTLDEDAVTDFRAFLLERIGELNARRGWTTQLHVGAVRDYRASLRERVGPDSGGDVSTQAVDLADGLDHFLDVFDGEFDVVLYVLDPTHYPTVATIARAYPNVAIGPAWWFNDSPHGLERQLETVAAAGQLASYAGMVSDSRKLVSYGSRFETFRRTLADVVGRLVDRGQVPMAHARDLVEHVAHDRPRELYGFD